MAERRTVVVAARVTRAERAAWKEKAAAAGVSPTALLRQAMARTQAWTAPALAVEGERRRQIARIGNNLNQFARWANAQPSAVETVTCEWDSQGDQDGAIPRARLTGDSDGGSRSPHVLRGAKCVQVRASAYRIVDQAVRSGASIRRFGVPGRRTSTRSANRSGPPSGPGDWPLAADIR